MDDVVTLFTRAATIGVQSWNEEARTLDVVFATSNPVERQDYKGAFLERLDEHYEKRPGEMPNLTRPPSSFVEEGRVVISCEPEEHGIAYAAERLGPGAVVYASDYPHWDAEFPGSVAAIRDQEDLDVATRRGVRLERALQSQDVLVACPLSGKPNRPDFEQRPRLLQVGALVR